LWKVGKREKAKRAGDDEKGKEKRELILANFISFSFSIMPKERAFSSE